ncbi:hypothetical protein DVH24_001933 [Malus domestica]|uniref:Uncharacterized protein n=1 Tax=Malus domestica TaxID=3750 RepID=A0A498I8N8_MALDO|nr:hypothetical protein DVH24_001933 [Malus domestica]
MALVKKSEESRFYVVALLFYAADNHGDVVDRIRKVADEDPIHHKIFIHGLGWDTNAETLTGVFKELLILMGLSVDCRERRRS